MNKSLVWTIVVLVLAALLGWWWLSNHAPVPMTSLPTTETAASQTPATPGAATATQTGTTTTMTSTATASGKGDLLLDTGSRVQIGTYLVAANGMTLYLYAKDAKGISNCTGACAVNWPPYTVTAATDLKNLSSSIMGAVATVKRADGSLQLTYKGLPLYFYVGDTKAGDTTGQGVGGVWTVAKP